jgi:hypothetical protein
MANGYGARGIQLPAGRIWRPLGRMASTPGWLMAGMAKIKAAEASAKRADKRKRAMSIRMHLDCEWGKKIEAEKGRVGDCADVCSQGVAIRNLLQRRASTMVASMMECPDDGLESFR